MEPAEIEKYMALKASRKKASQKFYATHVKDVKERTPEEEVRKEAMLVYRREKAKALKPNTVNTYTRHLESLAKAYGIPLDQALKEDTELNTFNKLYAEKSPHSVKATMVSVHSLLCGKKHGNGQKCDNVVAEPFHSRMVEINKAFSSEAEKQEKTEKQAENWATLDELKGLMDKYRRESLEYVCRRTGEKDVEM